MGGCGWGWGWDERRWGIGEEEEGRGGKRREEREEEREEREKEEEEQEGRGRGEGGCPDQVGVQPALCCHLPSSLPASNWPRHLPGAFIGSLLPIKAPFFFSL